MSTLLQKEKLHYVIFFPRMFMAIKKIYGDGVEKLCVYCFLLVLDMVHECLLF